MKANKYFQEFLMRGLSAYNQYNTQHPWKVNTVMGFCIASVGDIMCQYALVPKVGPGNSTFSSASTQVYIDKNMQESSLIGGSVFIWDRTQTLYMGMIRAVIVGPFIMKWYRILQYVKIGSAWVNFGCRLIIDTFIGSPTVVSLVMTANLFLRRNTVVPITCSEIVDNIRLRAFEAWRFGLHFNPFIVGFNFAFVPPPHQALFAHVSSIFWNAVLSYHANMNYEK
jgi:hypothetical protein